MSLLFVGPKGSFEVRWMVYAVLRDNVQHHLEGGTPTERFAALHKVSEALGGGTLKLDAQQLAREIREAAEQLKTLPVGEFAISGRTRAVMQMTWPPPAERTTMLLKESGVTLPLIDERVRTLEDICGAMIGSVARVTQGAGAGDLVEVSDI